ncbi:MAG TPA: cellulase family glycosylhydrolase [Acidimicrobiales bacterium]|nr:cellulase family glycosylhydrolase [Acidimicrobiales bacterium]
MSRRRLAFGAAAGLGSVISAALAVASLGGPAPALATQVNGNLFAGDTASFDGGTVGSWTALTSGIGLSNETASTQAGAGALAVTSSVSQGADGYVASGAPGSGTATPAAAGDTYSASAWVEAASASRSVAAVLVFYNSAGGAISAAYGQGLSDTTSSWSRLPTVTGLAPQGTTSVALAVDFWQLAAGETHYVDTASLAVGGGGAAAVAGPLHTQGNQIYSSSGPIVFRGIHRDGTENIPANFPSDTEIGAIHSWGANFVRVPLSESLWVNTCSRSHPSNDTSYPSKVDSEVNSITSRHMVALLDLHESVMSQCGSQGLQPMADAKFAPSFWGAVASRYAKNPLVAFDLYNEPHDISDSVWLNGGSVSYNGVTFQAVGMRSLYNKVRSYAPSSLVFVNGNNWATRPAVTPVSGTNIVNGAHYYTCPTAAPPSCTTPNPYDPSPGLSNWLTVSRTAPVMVTEFGWPSKSDGTYNANVIAYAESHGWGWDAFAWDGTTSGTFDMLADTGPYYEPAPSGMPVLNGLAAN